MKSAVKPSRVLFCSQNGHSSIVRLCSVAKTWVEAVRLSVSTVPSAVVLNFGKRLMALGGGISPHVKLGSANFSQWSVVVANFLFTRATRR